MAHPMHEHRQTAKEHSRVGRITKGYKSGGAVKGERAIGKKALSLHRQEHQELHAEGHKAKHRMDRPKRAKGGKVKGKHNAKTIVNVIAGGHPAGGAVPNIPSPPLGVAPAAMPSAPPPMAAKPPMPMPPPGAMAGPGAPPPMPMRAKGGKVHRDTGGNVKPPAQMTPDSLLAEAQRRHDQAVQQGRSSTLTGQLYGVQREQPSGRARGGHVKRADGGSTKLAGDVMDFPITMQQSDSRRISGMKNPPPDSGSPPPKVLKGPGAAAAGGRITRAKGGGVKSIGMNVGTKVQHTDGKDDGKDIGRGRVVTFWAGGGVKKKCDGGPTMPTRAKGGRVESPQGVAKATRLPGGSGGGEARLAKEHRAERR